MINCYYWQAKEGRIEMDNKVIANDWLRSQLGGGDKPLEICDNAGKTLGHFVPVGIYQQLVHAAVKYPPDLTPEEFQRRFAEGNGKPLAQIWQELGRT
jgi:hypothetical protein